MTPARAKRARTKGTSTTRNVAVAHKNIVFIEAWINPIFVRFANEFARQNPDWKVYYLTDSDSLGDGAMDAVSARVTLIGLRNSKSVRRIAYLPLYLASMISARARAKYADTLYLHTFRGLQKTLDTINPSVIQSNVFVMPYTMQASRYAARRRIPFILRTEERAPHALFPRVALNALLILNKRIIKNAALILPWTVQSESFAREQLHVPKSRIELLPAGVDTTLFTSSGRKTRSAKDPVRLLVVQRFVPYKDYPTLLRGVRAAIDGGLDCTLSILGFGPDEASVRALVKELGLSSIVRFVPQTPYEKMPALYREHDVLVHTGRHEAIGMVVPESMACGVVPVVCDTAGAITYVTKETGIVFTTGDAAALGRTLASLTPARVAKMGTAAASAITKQYTVPHIVREYTKLLKNRVL